MVSHPAFDQLQEALHYARSKRGRDPLTVQVSTSMWARLSMRARDRAAEWERDGMKDGIHWTDPVHWLGSIPVEEAPSQAEPFGFTWGRKDKGECEHGERSEFECLPCLRVAYGKARSREHGAKWEKEQFVLSRQGGNDMQREHAALVGIVRGFYGRFVHQGREEHEIEGCPFCEAEELLGERVKPDPT